jgi:hypothetical protein
VSERVQRPDREALVSAWSARDHARAVLRADHVIIDESVGARALVADLVLSETPGDGTTASPPERGRSMDELYDACAVIGRLIAQRGGSPTLASATIDGLCEVTGTRDAPWAAPARAAVAEGFAGTLVEGARRESMQAWEYPSCAVPLGQAAVAIAAGHPSDDDEVIAAWAARVAKAAALTGVRRAVVSGSERAKGAVVEACQLVGIEVQLRRGSDET